MRTKTKTIKVRKVKLTQIQVGHFKGYHGLSWTLIGLGTDGAVYRYNVKERKWIRYNMEYEIEMIAKNEEEIPFG